jgi:4a-hydroxytetrahydrobiopterin dehydratase
VSSDTLSDDQIDQALLKLSGWRRDGKTIVKVYDCRDFDGSMKFVNAVANIANAANHHPDMSIAWNRVTVSTSSHDAGGVTARDIDLATRIEAVGT